MSELAPMTAEEFERITKGETTPFGDRIARMDAALERIIRWYNSCEDADIEQIAREARQK